MGPFAVFGACYGTPMAAPRPITTLLESLSPARWYAEYTSFASPIVLHTDTAGPADGVNARGIRVVAGTGSIVVRMGVASETDITLTVSAAGTDFPGDFREIRSVSGITRVLVRW